MGLTNEDDAISNFPRIFHQIFDIPFFLGHLKGLVLSICVILVFRVFQPIVLMLVGNKTDLEHRRVIRIERHTKCALQYGMSSYYVSAKTGDGVTLMFR